MLVDEHVAYYELLVSLLLLACCMDQISPVVLPTMSKGSFLLIRS